MKVVALFVIFLSLVFACNVSSQVERTYLSRKERDEILADFTAHPTKTNYLDRHVVEPTEKEMDIFWPMLEKRLRQEINFRYAVIHYYTFFNDNNYYPEKGLRTFYHRY